MTQVSPPLPLPPPSLRTLALSTVAAIIMAAIILVTLVLPAEYAIDPLGTGEWLGLTQIARPVVAPVERPAPEGAALVPVAAGPAGIYPAAFHYDVVEIVLAPYEYVEYKYQLEAGATMVFSWTASSAVIQDFHGETVEADANREPNVQSYDKQDRAHMSGSLIAPFRGIHGWYWENPGGTPVTVRLTSSGYYSGAIEIRSDQTRHVHALRAINTLSPLPEGGAAK